MTALKPLLRLGLENKLKITPQLQQAIQLLHLSHHELQTKIESMLAENPMLDTQDNSTYDERNFLYDNRSSGTVDLLESISDKAPSLQTYLLWQMELTPFSEQDKLIAETLIDAINEDGFLGDFEEILQSLQAEHLIEREEVLAVLHRIQRFDPLGCGARSIAEYLQIQIEHLPEHVSWQKKAKLLVTHYLPYLAKRDYRTLQRKLNLNQDELQEVLRGLKSLKLRPEISQTDSISELKIPDVRVFKKEGLWHVALVSRDRLVINDAYVDLMKNNQKGHRSSLKKQFLEAKWFLKSLEKRDETLLKVTRCIVQAQREFLEKGESAMKPLLIKEIAKELGMNASTISRVTSNKYLATPRGTFSLRYFFSSSQTAIGALIKKMVLGENPLKPLSDNKLMRLLQTRGIHLARRTVTKYRELLMIPSSDKRKQLI